MKRSVILLVILFLLVATAAFAAQIESVPSSDTGSVAVASTAEPIAVRYDRAKHGDLQWQRGNSRNGYQGHWVKIPASYHDNILVWPNGAMEMAKCGNELPSPPKPPKVIIKTLPGKVITREVPVPSEPETIIVEGPERIVTNTVEVKVPVYVAMEVTPQPQNGMFGPMNGYSTSYTSGGSINLAGLDSGTRITNNVNAKGGLGVGVGGGGGSTSAVGGATSAIGTTAIDGGGPGGSVGIGTVHQGDSFSASAGADGGSPTVNITEHN